MKNKFMEKSKKFKRNLDDSCTRKEILDNGDVAKEAKFIVSGLEWGIKKGVGFDEKSDEILAKEKDNLEERPVLYEWLCNNFFKVENVGGK